MSIHLASNLVNTQIDDMNLQEHDKTMVKKCVSGYSKPNSFLEKISWVAYRIFNAIKSIFGQSDWQKAKKILLGNNEKDVPEDLKGLFSKKLLEDLALTSLKIMVKLNESKVETSKDFFKVLQGVDLENFNKVRKLFGNPVFSNA